MADCPPATPASAITALDATDPPFLFASSQHDFVPGDSNAVMAARMRRLSVPVDVVTVPGSAHAAQLLVGTDLTDTVVRFLRRWD
jgi:acetyl esterase